MAKGTILDFALIDITTAPFLNGIIKSLVRLIVPSGKMPTNSYLICHEYDDLQE